MPFCQKMVKLPGHRVAIVGNNDTIDGRRKLEDAAIRKSARPTFRGG